MASHLAPLHRQLPAQALPRSPAKSRTNQVFDANARLHLIAHWAQGASEVRQAQAFRGQVLGDTRRANQALAPDFDEAATSVERYDAWCDHLLVYAPTPDDDLLPFESRETRDFLGLSHHRVVGACRVKSPEIMSPQSSVRPQCLADAAFDLTALQPLRSNAAELSGFCLDPSFQAGGVSMLIAEQICEYLRRHALRWAIAIVDVPIHDGGHGAASLWRALMQSHAAPTSQRIRPRQRPPWSTLRQGLPVSTPALLQGLLRGGAKVLGEPAWDAQHGVAALALLLDLETMPERHATRVLTA
jgi:putative hemolysin